MPAGKEDSKFGMKPMDLCKLPSLDGNCRLSLWMGHRMMEVGDGSFHWEVVMSSSIVKSIHDCYNLYYAISPDSVFLYGFLTCISEDGV